MACPNVLLLLPTSPDGSAMCDPLTVSMGWAWCVYGVERLGADNPMK